MKLIRVAYASAVMAAVGSALDPAVGLAGPIPMTGTDIAALRGIDGVVTNFMTGYGVPGLAFGLVKDGRLIFLRGYGYADSVAGELVQPDSLFRLASLTKSVTAAAILKLVEQGQLSLSQSAFGLLNYSPPTYPGAAVDSRLASVTVRQLLNHTGGWNRSTAVNPDGSLGFDPTVNWTVRAATEMGTSSPADAPTIVRWMMGKPLQFDPGTQYQYSNFGYTVLGRIIETLSGLPYEQFVRGVLAQAGVARMRIAGSRLAEKAPGEVTYYDYPDAALVASIFPQDSAPIPLPYDFSYAAMDSHGGWIASAVDLLRFITAVDGRPVPPDILSSNSIGSMIARPSPPWGPTQEPYYGMGWLVRNTPDNWWHTGALPGTATEMVRAGNGFTWVILANFRAYRSDNAFFNDLDQLGWNSLASVSQWPTNNLFDATLSYEAWKAKHFTAAELADPTISGDAADPDGDGLANLVEYSLGLDPKTVDRDRRPTPAVQTINGQPYLTLTFRRLLLAHEVGYAVEVSDDLANWRATAQPVGSPVLGDDGYLTATYRDESPISNATAARYLRVRVTLLPR
jgi:N-acyl-D-amino-acid deacylase